MLHEHQNGLPALTFHNSRFGWRIVVRNGVFKAFPRPFDSVTMLHETHTRPAHQNDDR
jgi:hypothetical protein